MDNREILFEKIEAKEKEWDEQVRYMKSKVASFEPAAREKIEQQLNNLHTKLKEIEERTDQLKRISAGVQGDLGERIIHTWIEIFTEIDNVMLKLKNKLE